MEKLNLISLKDIEIDDGFWNRYLNLVLEEVIPYQWAILNDQLQGVETSHCIRNFRIAAGLEEGEFYGAVFQDTDVAKWLEAVAYVLMRQKEPLWEQRADEVIDLIGLAQWDDGYINTYYTIKEKGKRFTNLREGHELYTAGHLMEAAVAYYKATGKDKFLRIMCRFANLICDVFSEENRKDAYPGHQEVELGLLKMYEVTNERRYLEQARLFLERRGRKPNFFEEESKAEGYHEIFPEFRDYDLRYSQCHLPVRQQKTAEGHAVRATYMYAAMADVAAACDDGELLKTCETLWENMVCRRMYITGSIGSSGLLERFTTDYDLPNNCNYSESCASIGLALFSRRMAQITADAKYMDVVEVALYNTVLAGISMDGKSFFYVNPLEVWPENCMERTSREHVKPVRQKWFGVACCPPNIARTLASLGEYLVFQRKENIYWNLYMGVKVHVTAADCRITIQMETDFPNNGDVSVRIIADNRYKGNFYLRIPQYVNDYSIYVDGREQTCEIVKGYAQIPVDGNTCHIVLKMKLPPRIVRSNPRIRENIGKVAVMKGPVVYCMEEQDNGANLPGYYLDSSTLREMYDAELLGGTTVICGSGVREETENWDEDEPYGVKRPVWRDAELTFIPYAYWCNRKPGEMLVWVRELQNGMDRQGERDGRKERT